MIFKKNVERVDFKNFAEIFEKDFSGEKNYH